MKLIYSIPKAALVLLFVLFSASAAAQDISEELSDFNEVKVFNGVEVELIPAKENRIEVTGHSKEKVKFELVENRLEIRLSLENIWSDDNTRITVYFRSLQVIDANESSTVRLNREFTGGNMVFRAQEGASILARINATKASVKAVTGGQIHLRGEANGQEVEINTGGHYYGKDFETESTHVEITAGGRAEVQATEYCKATAKLGGTIQVFGNPKTLDRKTSLGGSISEMN